MRDPSALGSCRGSTRGAAPGPCHRPPRRSRPATSRWKATARNQTASRTAVTGGDAGEIPRVHTDAGVGEPLHVGHRRVVVFFRSVPADSCRECWRRRPVWSGLSSQCLCSCGQWECYVPIHVHGLKGDYIGETMRFRTNCDQKTLGDFIQFAHKYNEIKAVSVTVLGL